MFSYYSVSDIGFTSAVSAEMRRQGDGYIIIEVRTLRFTSSLTCFIAPGMAYIPVESDDVRENKRYILICTDVRNRDLIMICSSKVSIQAQLELSAV